MPALLFASVNYLLATIPVPRVSSNTSRGLAG
jgi:hypothetical protein